MHPEGLAPAIANLPEWRGHLLARLRHQIALSADPLLEDLLDELSSYPVPKARVGRANMEQKYAAMARPLQLITEAGLLTFISTTMMFGTPVDITLSELAIESFFPANAGTAEILHRLATERD